MNGDAFRLDGQLALVTGGGTGLGFGICQAMVEAGARVVITGRREEVLHDACVQLKGGAQYLPHDINDLSLGPERWSKRSRTGSAPCTSWSTTRAIT